MDSTSIINIRYNLITIILSLLLLLSCILRNVCRYWHNKRDQFTDQLKICRWWTLCTLHQVSRQHSGNLAEINQKSEVNKHSHTLQDGNNHGIQFGDLVQIGQIHRIIY